jgi:hypothetical protein
MITQRDVKVEEEAALNAQVIALTRSPRPV